MTTSTTTADAPPLITNTTSSSDAAPTPTVTATRVGFIGLGNMGTPMALNLRRGLARARGAVLFVYDVAPRAVQDFLARCQEGGDADADAGAEVRVCASCREVGMNSDVTFVIVPEGAHVRAVFLDPETGLLAGAGSGSDSGSSSGSDSGEAEGTQTQTRTKPKTKTYVDCSTIDIATSLDIAHAVAESRASAKGSARFYDAPVSGGTRGAARGTLTFMCGAAPARADAHFASVVAPLLYTMGSSVFCLGEGEGAAGEGVAGRGLAAKLAKLANNYLSGVIAIATSEAMNLGMRLGVDAHLLSGVFARSSGANWVNETTNPVPGVCPDAVTSHGYRGGFKVQLMRKDVGLAVGAAGRVGARLVLGDAALATYAAAAADPRCADLDSRVVYRWLGGVEPEPEVRRAGEEEEEEE